ncbi:hypothetical protein [Microbacterium halotolerans]|uniref:hypothetical protein n=1 Tax=Microbacterium halotolerans TaxID=246613 RepID=UPI0013C2E0AE|nr:hypothetical protein [Microbacterium halotolerans]
MECLLKDSLHLDPQRDAAMTRTGRWSIVIATVAAATVGVLASCAEPDTEPPGEFAVYESAGAENGGFAAGLMGTMTEQDGCIYVTSQDGERWLPVFDEATTSWSDETIRHGSETFALGAEVKLGGAEASPSFGSAVLPDACDLDAPQWALTPR